MNLIISISMFILHQSVSSQYHHDQEQRSLQESPPIVTFGGDDTECGLCEFLGSTCFVYNIGKEYPFSSFINKCFHLLLGSLKVCTIISLINPPVGITCNIVASPGRIACLGITLVCFKLGCGAIRIPSDLPRIVHKP